MWGLDWSRGKSRDWSAIATKSFVLLAMAGVMTACSTLKQQEAPVVETDNHAEVIQHFEDDDLDATDLYAKGMDLWQQNQPDAAMAVFDKIDRRFGEDTSACVRASVAMALASKGMILGKQGKHDAEVAVYDEVDRRFGEDASDCVRVPVAIALNNKGIVLLESLGDAEGALAAVDTVLARYGNSPDGELQKLHFMALENSVEPLIVLGRNAEAVKRIQQVLQQAAASDQERAIMPFMNWLVKPKMPARTVRNAIRSLPPDVEYTWTLSAIRSHISGFPVPRKSQAICFIDFFERHHDNEELDACLNTVDKTKQGTKRKRIRRGARSVSKG